LRELQVLCKNEIRYRALEGTDRAKELIREVNEQIQRHNAMTGMTPCPYSYQYVDKESVPLDGLVMPKPTHWLKLKLTEMLVELENRVDRHNSGSWIVNDDALQEYKDGIIYIKQLLSA